MQEIQTMLMSNGYDVGSYGTDGRYGKDTATAVLGFQMDYMPRSDGWDGKPGPKTQTALEKVEAARLQGQQVAATKAPQQAEQLVDECDALDPGTWGSGNVCVLEGGRWVRRTKKSVALPKNAAPQITARETGFSADYSQVTVGSSYKIAVLDAWLNERRKKGLIATRYHGPTFAEYISHNPSSFLSSIFGVKKAGGELIYGTLGVMATGGLGLGAKAIQVAVARMAASLATKASSMGAMGSMMEKVFGTDAEGMAASAVESAHVFAETHTVIVGSKRVKISALPATKNSVKSFDKFIVDYIIKFQKMHF
jgi:peptidoglycan hydrolase-like protein with peptidoglycan-binding domain